MEKQKAVLRVEPSAELPVVSTVERSVDCLVAAKAACLAVKTAVCWVELWAVSKAARSVATTAVDLAALMVD